MRTEGEIREAYGYLMQAYNQAVADGETIESDKLGFGCHALSWAFGQDGVFQSVVEMARKTTDDIELDVKILETEL